MPIFRGKLDHAWKIFNKNKKKWYYFYFGSKFESKQGQFNTSDPPATKNNAGYNIFHVNYKDNKSFKN